jgi:hypothetical protein
MNRHTTPSLLRRQQQHKCDALLSVKAWCHVMTCCFQGLLFSLIKAESEQTMDVAHLLPDHGSICV